MRLSRVLIIVSMLFAAMSSGTVEAVMVDFELPDYTAGQPWLNVDGWVTYPQINWGASTLITPSGEHTMVLSGSQSGGMGGDAQSGMGRVFDSGGTGEFATGDYHTVLSCLMQADGPSGGTANFFYSNAPANAATPGGIEGHIGGNFLLFGNTPGYYLDSGISFLSGITYKLEIELNVDINKFKAYATNLTNSGPRTLLGTMNLLGTITPAMYPVSGFSISTTGDAFAVYDDFDVYEVAAEPTVPLLSNPVNFEHAVYIAGGPVTGIDGWEASIWTPTTQIVTSNVLEGSKSLKVSGADNALQRNFGPDTTYEDGSIISARMKLLGSATQEGTGGFYFSNNQSGLATPAGITGFDDGNFWIFGKKNGEIVSDDGIDTGIPFLTGVEYLLEMQFDFTNQIFYSYVTDLTNGGSRTLLGDAEFWLNIPGETVEPGDTNNSGYVLITRHNAEVIFDDLNMVAGTLPVFAPGDADRNGVVNAADAAILAANWLAADADWGMGDFNDDGVVNDVDATLLAANWQASAASASVPEPSAAIALSVLLLSAMFLRRRDEHRNVQGPIPNDQRSLGIGN